MNKNYEEIMFELNNITRIQDDYSFGLKNSSDKLDTILEELPREDPIRYNLIAYLHSLQGPRFALSTSDALQEQHTRTNLFKRLGELSK